MRKIASRLRFTSASVVAHEETLIRPNLIDNDIAQNWFVLH